MVVSNTSSLSRFNFGCSNQLFGINYYTTDMVSKIIANKNCNSSNEYDYWAYLSFFCLLFIDNVEETLSLRWNSTGVTIAGISGFPCAASDCLNTPWTIALDLSNSLYVTDRYNHRVQKFKSGAKNAMQWEVLHWIC